MKNNLWVVIVVSATFLGFLIGYSLPPMVEVGVIGGGGEKPEAPTEVSEEMQDYYKDLLKD